MISANTTEGFGRYTNKDKIKFFRDSLGSLYESLYSNEKLHIRSLNNQDEYSYIFNKLVKLPKALNSPIQFTDKNLQLCQ